MSKNLKEARQRTGRYDSSGKKAEKLAIPVKHISRRRMEGITYKNKSPLFFRKGVSRNCDIQVFEGHPSATIRGNPSYSKKIIMIPRKSESFRKNWKHKEERWGTFGQIRIYHSFYFEEERSYQPNFIYDNQGNCR